MALSIAAAWAAVKTATTVKNVSKVGISIAAVLALFVGGKSYVAKKHKEIYETGFNKATAECNVGNLESALKSANSRAAKAEQRTKDLLVQKDNLEASKAELRLFTDSLEEQLAGLKSGDISPKTNKYLVIVNERNKILIEENEETPTE